MKADRVEYYDLTLAELSLLKAGVSVAGIRFPLIYDPIYIPEQIDEDLFRVKLAVRNADAVVGKEYTSDESVISLSDEVVNDDILTEIKETAIKELDYRKDQDSQWCEVDGVKYGIHEAARSAWNSLLHRFSCGPISFPIPFLSYDGSVVQLSSEQQARELYAQLFDAGLSVQIQTVQKQMAVKSASTAAEIVAILKT